MLKIRLSRTGKKRQPSYRIVVQEHTAAVKGKALDSLGNYQPAIKPKQFVCDVDKVKYWISKGAQPSDTLAVLLKKQGVPDMDRYIAARTQKRKSKKDMGEAHLPPVPASVPPSPAATPTPAAAAPAAPAKV